MFHKKERSIGLLAGLILLVAFSACQDDRLFPQPGGEDGEPATDAVSFKATLVDKDIASRGTPLNGPAYPNGSSFGVLGYQLPKNVWETTLTPDFMYNFKVTHLNNQYTYDNTKLWPSQRVRFFAYHPFATADNRISPSAADYAGDPYLQFRVRNLVVSQIDLLVSSTEPVLAPSVVSFPFTHALTRIAFFVKKAPVPGEVKVNAITLKSIIEAGQVSLVPAADGRYSWQPSTDPGDVTEYVLGASTLNGIERGLIPTELQNITDADYEPVCSPNGTLFLIPQPIVSENSYLIVTYTLDGLESKLNIPLPSTTPGESGEWLSGRFIRYLLTITP